MTLKAMRLLSKLKKAQLRQDELVYIDFDSLSACTVHEKGQPFGDISLRNYAGSIQSTLSYLEKLGYIECNKIGYVKVTHSGWCAFQVTVQDAVKFTVRDVLVPILVSIATTIALRYI